MTPFCSVCACLVCRLLTTCVLVFLFYSYLLSSSDETKVERQEKKVNLKQEKASDEGKVKQPRKVTQKKDMPIYKEPDADAVPDSVLSKVKRISVLQKTATFTVSEHVSFMPFACW